MVETKSKDIRVKDKAEMNVSAEQTKEGPVFVPQVDIFETEKEIMLSADMPGVSADKILIDLRENILTIDGDALCVCPGPEEETVYKEFNTGRYYRQFTLSEVIDQEKIDASMKDGVLYLKLPKVEKATPRKISVKTA